MNNSKKLKTWIVDAKVFIIYDGSNKKLEAEEDAFANKVGEVY